MKKAWLAQIVFLVLLTVGQSAAVASPMACLPIQPAAHLSASCCGGCDCEISDGARSVDWAGAVSLSHPEPFTELSLAERAPLPGDRFTSDGAEPDTGPPGSSTEALLELLGQYRV